MTPQDRQSKFRAFHGGAGSDRKALFERLYNESYASVYNSVYYRVLNQDAAQDITSDAYVRAARFFDRFDPSRASFATWVKSIACNCVSDYYRKSRPTTVLDDVPESYLADDHDHAEETANADLARRLLALLDDESRQLVFLKYYDGMRNVEIARELGMNESTVATKLQRAMKLMRSAADAR